MPKYAVQRTFNAGDRGMIFAEPNKQMPQRIVEMPAKEAKPFVDAGHLKSARKRK